MSLAKGIEQAFRRQRREAAEAEKRLQRRLTPLVQALTEPDEPQRRAAAEHVLQVCLPAVVARLADRLVGLLRTGGGTARRQAAVSLVQFGARSLPALVVKFTKARGAGKQLAIAEVLYGIAPGLGQDERVKLLADLMLLARFALDITAAAAIARVVLALRQAEEAQART